MLPDAVPESGFLAAMRDATRPAPGNLGAPGGRPAGNRFDVYRNNMAVGLVEALADIFPAVRAQCGAARFHDVARLYVADHPPQSKLLFQYGASFAEFLDAFAPARQQMPWLADLARLERGWLDAWHAADADPLANDALAAVAPDRLAELVFVAHPAARVVASRFAIHDLFIDGRDGRQTANPHAPQAVLIARPHLAVTVHPLDGANAAFFSAILAGTALGAATESANRTDPAFNLANAIGVLLTAGATAALELDR